MFKNIYNFLIRSLKRTTNNLRNKKHIAELIGDDKDLFKHIIEYNKTRVNGFDSTICHVPMRSLYFGFGGIVTACCFNREYVLGRFPENTIEEIIHGEKRKILQQYLDKIDFSHGCYLCKDIIASGNYMSAGTRLTDKLPEQGDFPSKMEFELDNICNLRCEMCSAEFSSAHANGKRTVYPYDDNNFIEQLKPFIPHLVETKFLGGEPFLSNLYPKIWELIITLNPKCKIRVQSNGTILNDKLKSILQRGNFQIGLSIDTLNPDRYAKIRNGEKIESVLGNIDFFNYICKKNKDNLSVSVCPMKENRFDIPELVKFCNYKNIFIYFNNVITEGFALSELSPIELEELAAYYKRNNPKSYKYISIHNDIAFSNLIKEVEYLKEQCKHKKHSDSMIPWTKKEFFETILSIIPNNELYINQVESLLIYIPENFLIKRSRYYHLKNELTIDELKIFFKSPLTDQINYFKDNFINNQIQ